MRIDIKYAAIVIVVLLAIIAFLLISYNNAPPPTVNYQAGFLDPGGPADRVCTTWCGRLSGVAILSMLLGAGYYYYAYQMYQIAEWGEVEKAKIIAEVDQIRTMVTPPDKARVIPFNSSGSTLVHSGQMRLTESLTIQKKDLIQFITESTRPDGIGLAISRWKNEMGWDQSKVENLLDWFADIEVVTARASGKACTYTRGYSARELLKVVSENAFEVG